MQIEFASRNHDSMGYFDAFKHWAKHPPMMISLKLTYLLYFTNCSVTVYTDPGLFWFGTPLNTVLEIYNFSFWLQSIVASWRQPLFPPLWCNYSPSRYNLKNRLLSRLTPKHGHEISLHDFLIQWLIRSRVNHKILYMTLHWYVVLEPCLTKSQVYSKSST